MNAAEEFLILNEGNFSDHIAEIKSLFGFEPRESEKLEIRWVSGGGIEYRIEPFGTKYKDKAFDRFVIEEPANERGIITKPRFFIRTHGDGGIILLIECIPEYQLKEWGEAVSANKNYFSREERYRINGSNNTTTDTVFFEASDSAYIKYSIKRSRLNGSQIKELRKILKHFIDTVRIPRGQNDNNKFDVGQLQCELEELTKDEGVKKPRKNLIST